MLFCIRLHCFLLTGFLYSRLITTSWPASVRSWPSSCLRRPQRSSRYSTRLLRWSIFFRPLPPSLSGLCQLIQVLYQSRHSRRPRSIRCSMLQHVFRPLSALFSDLCRPCFPASVGLVFRPLSALFSGLSRPWFPASVGLVFRPLSASFLPLLILISASVDLVSDLVSFLNLTLYASQCCGSVSREPN